ncbi:MAG: universal stress protein [Paludibacteraceae bacterium]|nr:universal stress protein [Paludibacteraceae bacterium]
MRPVAVISIENDALPTVRQVAATIANVMGFSVEEVGQDDLPLLDEWVECHDAALVVIGLDVKTKIQPILDKTRGLRVPYLFVRIGQSFACKHIALPVTRFLEDREKGPYCGSFARNFHSRITIFKPKDYGSAAEKNIESIGNLLATQDLKFDVVAGKKDSSGIELEAVASDCDLCIIGASRDYGLDDIVFGPKERKILKYAKIPVLVINPRGDLYPLCD